jgi:predicted peptidase
MKIISNSRLLVNKIVILFAMMTVSTLAGFSRPQESLPSLKCERIKGFEGRVLNDTSFTFKMPYRIFIPDEYNLEKSYPLILALHGMGRRGNDNLRQITNEAEWATAYAKSEVQKEFPSFVLAPQTPQGTTFSPQWPRRADDEAEIKTFNYDVLPQPESYKMVMKILFDILDEFNIDRSRIYVTGNSMGGFSTLYFAISNPDLFAAAMPFAGGGDPSKAYRVAHMPIWIHHGDADHIVSVKFSRIMLEALESAGGLGEHKYTEYKDGNHGVYRNAFSIDENKNGIPDIVEWLLLQRKR